MPGQPIELVPLDSVYLEGPPHGFNMVAVKDTTVFDGPGYSIVKGVSPKYLRHKDPKLHHPVGGVVELAPGVAMQGAAGVGTELVVAEVHRGRQLGELGDIEVFARHAVCFAGSVVWIEV